MPCAVMPHGQLDLLHTPYAIYPTLLYEKTPNIGGIWIQTPFLYRIVIYAVA